MKKITLLSLVATAMLMSCGKDDNGPKQGLTLDDAFYTKFNSYSDDWGTYYYGPYTRDEGVNDTHRRFEIKLTDGDLGEQECWPAELYDFEITLSLYSPSTSESLQNGIYTITPYGTCCEDQTGEFFGQVRGYFDDTPNYDYVGGDGTITISGNFPNVTAVVDLDFYYYDYSGARQESIPTTFAPLTGTFKGTLVERCLGE